MLYLYDSAICEDLQNSFKSIENNQPIVKVVDAEGILGIIAQIKEDKINFPLVAITRDPNLSIADNLNFTRMHKGVCTVLDNKTNELYYEKAIPVNLRYAITVLTTNTADMDELLRELIFKYTSMYFLTITLPYECSRKVRFGIRIDKDSTIERSSAQLEYIQSGQLYQSILNVFCEGCVMVEYTPAKLMRVDPNVQIADINK